MEGVNLACGADGRLTFRRFGRGGVTPRTAAVLDVSEREAKQLAELQGLFPALPQSELRAALEQYGWNVNRAACELMDDLGLQ